MSLERNLMSLNMMILLLAFFITGEAMKQTENIIDSNPPNVIFKPQKILRNELLDLVANTLKWDDYSKLQSVYKNHREILKEVKYPDFIPKGVEHTNFRGASKLQLELLKTFYKTFTGKVCVKDVLFAPVNDDMNFSEINNRYGLQYGYHDEKIWCDVSRMPLEMREELLVWISSFAQDIPVCKFAVDQTSYGDKKHTDKMYAVALNTETKEIFQFKFTVPPIYYVHRFHCDNDPSKTTRVYAFDDELACHYPGNGYKFLDNIVKLLVQNGVPIPHAGTSLQFAVSAYTGRKYASANGCLLKKTTAYLLKNNAQNIHFQFKHGSAFEILVNNSVDNLEKFVDIWNILRNSFGESLSLWKPDENDNWTIFHSIFNRTCGRKQTCVSHKKKICDIILENGGKEAFEKLAEKYDVENLLEGLDHGGKNYLLNKIKKMEKEKVKSRKNKRKRESDE